MTQSLVQVESWAVELGMWLKGCVLFKYLLLIFQESYLQRPADVERSR